MRPFSGYLWVSGLHFSIYSALRTFFQQDQNQSTVSCFSDFSLHNIMGLGLIDYTIDMNDFDCILWELKSKFLVRQAKLGISCEVKVLIG